MGSMELCHHGDFGVICDKCLLVEARAALASMTAERDRLKDRLSRVMETLRNNHARAMANHQEAKADRDSLRAKLGELTASLEGIIQDQRDTIVGNNAYFEAKLGEVEAELSRVQEELKAADRGIENLNRVLTSERGEKERLKAALEKYGWHIGTCSKRMREFKEPCRCGFEAAIKGEKGGIHGA